MPKYVGVEDLLFQRGWYDLILAVQKNEVSAKRFDEKITDLVAELKIDKKKLNKEYIGAYCDNIKSALNMENFDYHGVVEQAIKLKDELEEAKAHNASLVSNRTARDRGDFMKQEMKEIIGDRYYFLNPIMREGLIVVGGTASSGKTSFVMDYILDTIRGEKKGTRMDGTKGYSPSETCLLFYTLDDSKAKVYNKLMKQSQLLDLEDREWILDNVYLQDSLSLNTLYLLRKNVLELKKRYKRVIIVVDYLQIVRTPESEFKKTYIDNIIYELKQVSKELNSTVFVLSQLNRSGSGKYSYRETSEIENQADVCLDLKKKLDGYFYLDVKKVKEGIAGEFWQMQITDYFTFTNFEHVEREAGDKY